MHLMTMGNPKTEVHVPRSIFANHRPNRMEHTRVMPSVSDVTERSALDNEKPTSIRSKPPFCVGDRCCYSFNVSNALSGAMETWYPGTIISVKKVTHESISREDDYWLRTAMKACRVKNVDEMKGIALPTEEHVGNYLLFLIFDDNSKDSFYWPKDAATVGKLVGPGNGTLHNGNRYNNVGLANKYHRIQYDSYGCPGKELIFHSDPTPTSLQLGDTVIVYFQNGHGDKGSADAWYRGIVAALYERNNIKYCDVFYDDFDYERNIPYFDCDSECTNPVAGGIGKVLFLNRGYERNNKSIDKTSKGKTKLSSWLTGLTVTNIQSSKDMSKISTGVIQNLYLKNDLDGDDSSNVVVEISFQLRNRNWTEMKPYNYVVEKLIQAKIEELRNNHNWDCIVDWIDARRYELVPIDATETRSISPETNTSVLSTTNAQKTNATLSSKKKAQKTTAPASAKLTNKQKRKIASVTHSASVSSPEEVIQVKRSKNPSVIMKEKTSSTKRGMSCVSHKTVEKVTAGKSKKHNEMNKNCTSSARICYTTSMDTEITALESDYDSESETSDVAAIVEDCQNQNLVGTLDPALSKVIFDAINSADCCYGTELFLYQIETLNRIPDEQFVLKLMKVLAHGPQSESGIFPDCYRMQLTSVVVQSLLRCLIQSKSRMNRILEQSGSSNEFYLPVAFFTQITSSYYMEDDTDDLNCCTSPALSRIGKSLHAKVCLMEAFSRLLDHEVFPLIGTNKYDKTNPFVSGIRDAVAVGFADNMSSSGAQRKSQPVIATLVEKSVEMCAQFWLLHGHFLYGDILSHVSDGTKARVLDFNNTDGGDRGTDDRILTNDDVELEEAVVFVQSQVRKMVELMGKLISYFGAMYRKEVKNNIDALVLLMNTAFDNILENRNELHPALKLSNVTEDEFLSKIKFGFVLSLQKKVVPKLQPKLAERFQVANLYNAVFGTDRVIIPSC